uniref:Uncharacterized protein n=1 Tax=Arundo donax TaxID=35708 RepID=A0A0A9G2V1_ARUDO
MNSSSSSPLSSCSSSFTRNGRGCDLSVLS